MLKYVCACIAVVVALIGLTVGALFLFYPSFIPGEFHTSSKHAHEKIDDYDKDADTNYPHINDGSGGGSAKKVVSSCERIHYGQTQPMVVHGRDGKMPDYTTFLSDGIPGDDYLLKLSSCVAFFKHAVLVAIASEAHTHPSTLVHSLCTNTFFCKAACGKLETSVEECYDSSKLVLLFPWPACCCTRTLPGAVVKCSDDTCSQYCHNIPALKTNRISYFMDQVLDVGNAHIAPITEFEMARRSTNVVTPSPDSPFVVCNYSVPRNPHIEPDSSRTFTHYPVNIARLPDPGLWSTLVSNALKASASNPGPARALSSLTKPTLAQIRAFVCNTLLHNNCYDDVLAPYTPHVILAKPLDSNGDYLLHTSVCGEF